MAVTAKLYGQAPLKFANKEIDWDTDTIKVALCTSSYTPNQDTHEYYDDLTNEVANGNGYTTGGATLANASASYTADGNIDKFDGDDVVWSDSSITARYAVIYCDTGTASTSALIGYIDFGEDKVSASGSFTITWDADGIFTATVA
jgi:hypothetical protein